MQICMCAISVFFAVFHLSAGFKWNRISIGEGEGNFAVTDPTKTELIRGLTFKTDEFKDIVGGVRDFTSKADAAREFTPIADKDVESISGLFVKAASPFEKKRKAVIDSRRSSKFEAFDFGRSKTSDKDFIQRDAKDKGDEIRSTKTENLKVARRAVIKSDGHKETFYTKDDTLRVNIVM